MKRVNWVHANSISKQEILAFEKKFRIGYKASKLAVTRTARPRAEKFDETITITAFSLEFEKARLAWKKHVIFFGKDFVVSMSEKSIKPIEKLLGEYKKGSKEFNCSPERMSYMILNEVIETYLPMVDALEESTDKIESQLMKNVTKKTELKKIFDLKKQTLSITKLLHPQIECINYLSRLGLSPKDIDTSIYLRQLHDYLLHLDDVITTQREILSGMMDAYTSVVSNKLNETMKLLTIIATIAMPLTVISSIYGMNIELPAQRDAMAFFYVIGAMLIVALAMVMVFRAKGVLEKR